MALSTLAKEQENFLRYAILIVDHTKEALQDLIELNLKNKHLTFEEFLNQNQHEIYHLCYDFRCCQCLTPPTKRKRILIPPQLELLFDKYNKLPSHKGTGHNDFCCSYAKVGITSQVLDLSLARCLLVNCCLDVFWFTCLTAHGQTLEQFLNSNKHTIYHLWKNNQNCCQCPPGFIFPRDYPVITENEWRGMFNSVLLPCLDDRKRTSTGTTSICSVAARPKINVTDIHPEIQELILKWCCSVRDSVKKLVKFRNINFGHVENAKLSDANFKELSKETEECILHIASFCKKDQIVKDALTNLHSRPIDATLCSHYQNILLENINRNEAISENINLQHRTTRRSIPGLVDKSCKIRKMEKRIDALEISNAKIKDEIQDIHKLVKEGPKRQRLIDQISAEFESHKKEGTYLETEAVRQCIQFLESRNVVILSGREGSGKSRNGLEILRQLKERHKDFDVFKLTGLHYVSNIVKCNVTTIVLFDDVFDKTSEQISSDEQVLNHLYSYISKHKVKVIFTMRNYVRHACHRLLSTHKIFRDFVDIDLNSKKFKLTAKEKEEMVTNYCTINKIRISENKKDATDQSVVNEDERAEPEVNQLEPAEAAVSLKRETMNEIIETDPFLGFPECCRLFTENRNSTTLDVSCFKWPSAALVNDIEKLRMEGINNYMNGLKYVILIHILTLGYSREKCQEYDSETDCSLVKRKIDAQDCKHIFKICYNMVLEVHTSHIEYVCKVLTERYLVYQDGAYYFQHKAIQDSVLISYNKINPNATIPLLTFGHLIDIVYSQNYIEQKDQIVIKISEPCYPALAKKIILILNSLSFQIDCYRLKESKLFTENDIDLVYQLILGIENEKDHHRHVISNYLGHFIPLYLLRNIGKLNDKMLTVKHTKDQMLISVTIVDKNIALSIDPQTSLIEAYYSNCIDILKWLLKHTDHTLLDFAEMFQEIKPDEFLEYTKLLLENVKHNMINMTKLLIETCFKCNSKENYKLDWIVDNVDNSLIDYHTCIEELLNEGCTDIIIHILKKVNHRWLNVKAIGKLCCENGCSEIVIWLLKNINHKLFDEEELLNIMIDEFEIDEDLFDNKSETLVELLILQKPEIICCSVNKLFPIANRSRWYDVLELLLKYASILSINKDRIIEHLFEYRYDEEQDCNVNGDFEEHCHKIFELIIKYPLHDIDVNKLFKKAVEGGLHKIVKELFNEKLNNISLYLDITLNKLRRRQFHQYYDFEDCNVGHGKILILLLQKTNNKSIDLNSIMNDVCHIGYSPVILWLLENKPSCYFDIRKVMNKVCYHGNLELVKYLTQKYRTEDFDLKTAMIKACRSSNSNFICIWLWENHDRRMLDMKAVLNNASRCGNTDFVYWILTEVDTELYDTEDALLCACEHGTDHTVELLLDTVGFNMINFQYATTLACRNKNSGLAITKRLFMRTKKSHLNMNAVLSDACKNYRTDIIQWIIQNCVQNIPVTETSDRNKHFIKHLDTNFVDISWLITCILDMDLPRQNTGNFDDKKYTLLLLILKKSNPRTIDIHKLLTESSRKNWIEIFKWIFLNGSIELSNIREATNTACHNGSLSIVKWSLENIEANILDLGNIMRESCGYGWLECLDLLKKHFNRYKFDMKAAMFEACTYNRPHIAEWLLHNVSYQHFDIRLILQEAGRNGWINIFGYLLQNFHFDKSDIHIATRHALENGHLEIAELGLTKIGKEYFDFSSLPKNAYVGANKEGVVNFLLHNIDPKSIDIATIMTNACLFGWKDIVTFIIDNDLSNLCDLSLAFNTACDNGELESAQLLLEKVDPHILISVDKAMYSVAVKGWDEIALLLLDKVEHTRLDIGNALIEACRQGEVDVVQAILRKVDNNMLDVKTAINKACENHMHEELVLWILENIDQEQVDLKTVKIQAVRHKWWKVQFSLTKEDIEDLNQAEQETETDNIIILE